MAVNVPPGSDGNPPLDNDISVSGKRAALLLLEQMKQQIDAIEAWVQTVSDQPGTDVPAEGSPPPPPSKHKKAGKKPAKKHKRR